MIRLNRTTEYGLVALRHMNRKHDQDSAAVTSAREIADHYGFPFEITAKTLQRLRDTGIIQSAQGSRGGYTLQRSLQEVTLAEFLELMEGPQSVVACAGQDGARTGGAASCEYDPRCEIKGLLAGLNQKVFRFLSGIPLAELTIDPKTVVPITRFGTAVGEEP
jgi:Rrf2 family protein